jgi:hypothetical protein
MHPNCICAVAPVIDEGDGSGLDLADFGDVLEADDEGDEFEAVGGTSQEYAPAKYEDVMGLLPEGDEALDKAIESYTSYGYQQMNGYLRRDDEVSQDIKDQVSTIQNALNRTSLPQDSEFMRGQRTFGEFHVINDQGVMKLQNDGEFVTNAEGGRVWQGITLMPDELIGQEWESKGFLSTSAKTYEGNERQSNFSKTEIQMHILAPAGTKGAGINSQEQEYLMPHGSKFEITDAKTIGNQIHIYMKVKNQ